MGKVLTGVVIVIFAFVGAEIATIAAAESDEPERSVTKATNSVIGRVLVFYVLSVFLIVSILPWDSTKLGESPFVAALDLIGIPAAADIMNAVVLTAVLSCLNSGIYVASRMMFALANRGDAPQWTVKVNSRGVPARAILLATVVGYVSVIFAALWPETIFLWLVNSSGAVALFVYLLIAISELRMRARLEREDPEKLQGAHVGLSVAHLAGDRRDRRRHRLDGVRRRRARPAVVEPRQPGGRAGRGVAAYDAAVAQHQRAQDDRASRRAASRQACRRPSRSETWESDDMIGYGPFHYRSWPSGREGDTFRVTVAKASQGGAVVARTCSA